MTQPDYRKRSKELFGLLPYCERCDNFERDIIIQLAEAFQQIAQEARRAAIEECAKIADGYEISQVAFSMKDPSLEIKSKLSGKAISKAIRALGEKE